MRGSSRGRTKVLPNPHPTTSRFESRDGQEVAVLPLQRHGDPIRGQILAYTSLGYDLLDHLRASGFRASLHVSRYAEQRRYGTFDSYTFIAQKA